MTGFHYLRVLSRTFFLCLSYASIHCRTLTRVYIIACTVQFQGFPYTAWRTVQLLLPWRDNLSGCALYMGGEVFTHNVWDFRETNLIQFFSSLHGPCSYKYILPFMVPAAINIFVYLPKKHDIFFPSWSLQL